MNLPSSNWKTLFPVFRYRDRYVKTKKDGERENREVSQSLPPLFLRGPLGCSIETRPWKDWAHPGDTQTRNRRTDRLSGAERVKASSGWERENRPAIQGWEEDTGKAGFKVTGKPGFPRGRAAAVKCQTAALWGLLPSCQRCPLTGFTSSYALNKDHWQQL